MRAYLRAYGWHFNKALYEDAVSKMTGRDGKPVQKMTKDELSDYFVVGVADDGTKPKRKRI